MELFHLALYWGSTNVSMVIPGKVKIKATIKWPNGICATLTTAIIDVMNYDIVKTMIGALIQSSQKRNPIPAKFSSSRHGPGGTGLSFF